MIENFSVEEKNKMLIKQYVLNHFGLTTESNERFFNLLEKPDVDETYLQYLDKDLRARFPVDKISLENYDNSWQLFKLYFQTYVKEFNLTYKDYLRGRIVVNKNELRVFKHVALYYLDSFRGRTAFYYDNELRNNLSLNRVTEIFENRINEVIRNRLPAKSNYEIVLSLNFADWFLCSTKEEWTSCFNLESQYFGSYWSGLPGFIVDKNKALLYITFGEKKEYLGIVTDKMLSRTFLTLNKRNQIRYLRWYPSDIFYSNGVFKDLPFEFHRLNEYEDSIKYNVNPLFFKNGWSCFGYQDKTMFKYSSSTDLKDIPFSVASKGGQFYIGKDNQYEEHSIFHWTHGFKKLKESGEEIQEKVEERCSNCGSILNEDGVFSYNNEIYCESCYNDRFLYCGECDRNYPRDQMFLIGQGNFCETCYNNLFVVCRNCENEVFRDEVENGEEPLCDYCRSRNR